MEGSKILKVVGILMIVFGGIAIILSLILAAGVAILDAAGLPMGAIWFATIMAILGAVAELVAGIIGVVNWNKLEKTMTCIVWGFIALAPSILSNFIFLVAYSESFSVTSLITGAVMPVLFLIGAFQNKAKISQRA